MTDKKTNPTKTGTVDLTAEKLQDEDLDRVIHGGAIVDPAANWDMFASGPKDPPARQFAFPIDGGKSISQ